MNATNTLSIKTRVARSMFWIAWSRGGLQLVAFATTLAVARLLNPSDYGLMALAGVWTTTLSILAELGLGAAIIQFRDLDKAEIDTCFWSTMAVALIGFGALFFAAPSIAAWFATPELSNVLRVSGIALPILAVRVVPDSLLRKDVALDRVSQAEIVSATAALPIIFLMARSGFGVWALVAGLIASALVRTVMTFVFRPWLPGFRFSGRRMRRVLHFSFATLGTRVLWILREQSDAFVIGKVNGEVMVGLYAMAKEFALLPTSKVSTVVNMLSSPVMAELQNDVPAMRAAFFRVVRLVASINLPACTGFLLLADPAVNVFLGSKWLAAIPLVQALCVYCAVRSLDVLFPPILFARHRAKFLFWYTVVLLLVMPVAYLAGALWWGPFGVIVVSIPAYCVAMSRMVIETLRELGSSPKELGRQLWHPFLATVLMAGIVLGAKLSFARLFGGMPQIEMLASLTIIGVLSYISSLALIGSPIIRELKEMLGWLLRRHTVGETVP